MPPKLRFERFEFKYLLDVETYQRVKRAMSPFLALDEAVAGLPHGFYEVISLYYDSPRFFYYWEKIDGASRRKKIRVRTYRRVAQDTNHIARGNQIFFEIKRKRDAVILKDRIDLTGKDYRAVLDSCYVSRESWQDAHSKRVYEEYLFEKHARVISPKLLVAYSREPYVGKYNRNLRITFDYGVRAKRTSDLFDMGGRFAEVSGAKVVMEVKFKGALPFYIDRVLKEFDLCRVPFSKYCLGIEACYSLPLLAMLANKNQSDTLRKTLNSNI